MKRINMTPYLVKIRQVDGTDKEVTYALKDSMVEILYNPGLKLNSISLLKQEELARKIANANNVELIIEEEEYTRLKSALESVQGLTKNDIGLVHRIMEAENIEVKPVEPVVSDPSIPTVVKPVDTTIANTTPNS